MTKSIITQGTHSIRQLRQNLNTALATIKDIEITNKSTRLKASISQHEINKISNPKAIEKSIANGFSKEEHFKVAELICTLYEEATLSQKHPDNKNRGWQVYRLISKIKINHKLAQVKITAFEKEVGKNRIYTIELEKKLEK
ncbi:hypothetical protein [Helicobacter sp. MIT 01-3238]|uniref:LPD3 domain-containing protein n=1 Tax=Helicobacter sp. MIT 01-3238 TaxID=398627 RepID=UPI000E1F3C3B|nr:hypothetical protein [Helicobacter sp. MIT 01-3238]RDU54279.1 hypothetical protein CQA40_03590 [Helicobacter sp. MIT 01-3238]